MTLPYFKAVQIMIDDSQITVSIIDASYIKSIVSFLLEEVLEVDSLETTQYSLDQLVHRLRTSSIDVQLPENSQYLIPLVQIFEDISAFIDYAEDIDTSSIFNIRAFMISLGELHIKATNNDTYHLLCPFLCMPQEIIRQQISGKAVAHPDDIHVIIKGSIDYFNMLLAYGIEPLINKNTFEDDRDMRMQLLIDIRDRFILDGRVREKVFDFSLQGQQKPTLTLV